MKHNEYSLIFEFRKTSFKNKTFYLFKNIYKKLNYLILKINIIFSEIHLNINII